MNNIITSLFIYKSQLYSSSLNGKITQTDISTQYKGIGVEFQLNDYFKYTIILDIKAYKDKLYILTRNGLYSYFNSNIEQIKHVEDAQVITIDNQLKILFIVSDSRGLIGLNLKNNKYIDDIKIKIFDNKNLTVPITSIVSNNGIVFISVLNSGIFRIDYKSKKSDFVYRKIQKIELKNPQDICFNDKDKELAIVDYDKGLIIINTSNGHPSYYQLPNEDIPNSIEIIKIFGEKYYIIQARKALYKFHVKDKSFTEIFKKRVSNLTTYYNVIYFTHQGEVQSIKV